MLRKVKLGISKNLNKYSFREANRVIKLYQSDAWNDYKMGVHEGYVLYRKSINKLERYRSIANILNIDYGLINTCIGMLEEAYKVYLKSYNLKNE